MSIVTVFVSCESSSSERRFHKDITIDRLKEKLEPITGVSAAYMKLQLFSTADVLVGTLDDDTKMLGFYPCDDFCRINVVDLNPHAVRGAFTDVSQVEKFELAEDDYDKRADTVRDYLRRNKLGKFNPEEQAKAAIAAETAETQQKEEAKHMKLGDRCEVETDSGFARRGAIRFIGATEFKQGLWIGVEYDEPVGKNDGMVDGVRYFSCRPKCGAFLRPNKVKVGDYPEEDLFDGLDEM